MKILLRAEALDPTTGELVVVCVRCKEDEFETFIVGGLLSSGEESFIASTVGGALAVAAQQISIIISGT
jgi:hypothetical protein